MMSDLIDHAIQNNIDPIVSANSKHKQSYAWILLIGLFFAIVITGVYTYFRTNTKRATIAQVGVAGSVGFNGSSACFPLSGNTYQCSNAQVGTQCENGSGAFSGQCVFWTCPYGDTNNDCGCGIGDREVASVTISCEQAKTKAQEIGTTCYQFDSLDAIGNWCIIDNTCKSVQDNFRTCVIKTDVVETHKVCNTTTFACETVSGPGISTCTDANQCAKPTLSCTGLTQTPSTIPAVGESLTFGCTGTVVPATAGKPTYNYRYSLNDGVWKTMVTDKSIEPRGILIIEACGDYKVECQACATLNGVLTCDPTWTGATQ